VTSENFSYTLNSFEGTHRHHYFHTRTFLFILYLYFWGPKSHDIV